MNMNFQQSIDGMYILKRDDFDVIATPVLHENMPRVLDRQNTVNIEYLAECYGLEIENHNITEDRRILGLMAFHNIEVPMFDSNMQPIRKCIEEGTIVIEKSLLGGGNLARRRFTLAHELAHWLLHRTYHSSSNQQFKLRRSYVACRTENIDKHIFRQDMTDNEREEWQANSLASAILMPYVTVIWAIHEAFRASGIKWNSVYVDGRNAISEYKKREILSYVAKTYAVSMQSAEIRLEHLGYFKKTRITIFP